MSPVWAKASACRLQVSLYCAVLCQIVLLPNLSRSYLHRSYFLVMWSPSGDTRCSSVVFEAVDMPCPGPFHFSHIADYIYDFCLTQMLVFPSLYVMLVFAPYVIAGSTHELYTCLFRQVGRLVFKISRCLAYAAHSAMILSCISLPWFFTSRL